MSYLSLRRSRVLLGSFLLFALLISVFPALDLQISGLFFDGRSFRQHWWQKMLRDGLPYLLAIAFGAVAIIYACNRHLKRNICNVDNRRVVYLLLVAAIGAGLIVNFAFKDHLGRARPRDIVEFGGTKLFTPPFIASQECRTNCSFSSGDAAGAFIFIALAKALTHRRRYYAAAIAFGALVSFARISTGAHFFSDTIVSFFVMLFVADILWHYIVLAPREP
jgi:lipid A 4'-phosphatase